MQGNPFALSHFGGAAMSRLEPPDLQALVIKHGGYDKITPEAWAEHDAAMADYQMRIRLGIGRDDQHSPARRMRR